MATPELLRGLKKALPNTFIGVSYLEQPWNKHILVILLKRIFCSKLTKVVVLI